MRPISRFLDLFDWMVDHAYKIAAVVIALILLTAIASWPAEALTLEGRVKIDGAEYEVRGQIDAVTPPPPEPEPPPVVVEPPPVVEAPPPVVVAPPPTALPPPVLPPEVPPTAADFCTGPGVIYCETFDDPSFMTRYHPPWVNGVRETRAAWDTDSKASGAGSLRFDIFDDTTADVSGQVLTYLPPEKSFGEGQQLVVEWKLRFSEHALNRAMIGGMSSKVWLFYDEKQCGVPALTTAVDQYGIAGFYTNCGGGENPNSRRWYPDATIAGRTNEWWQNQPGPVPGSRAPAGWLPGWCAHPSMHLCPVRVGVDGDDAWWQFRLVARLRKWNEAHPDNFASVEAGKVGEPLRVTNWIEGIHWRGANRFDRISLTPYRSHKTNELKFEPQAVWYDDVRFTVSDLPPVQ